MPMVGDDMGDEIVTALQSAGVIKSEKERHDWQVTAAAAGDYTITIDHADWDEQRDVTYAATASDSVGDIRDGLKAAAEADALAGALFDWSTPTADTVRGAVKTAGGSYTYSSTGSFSESDPGSVTDSSVEAEAQTTWRAIAGAIVSHIDDHAELNSTSTGTEGVID